MSLRFVSLFSPMVSMIKEMIPKGITGDIVECRTLKFIGER